MWKSLELCTNYLIVTICANLLNVSVNYCMCEGKLSEEIHAIDRDYDQQRDIQLVYLWVGKFY